MTVCCSYSEEKSSSRSIVLHGLTILQEKAGRLLIRGDKLPVV